MAATRLCFGDEARRKVLAGAAALADAVRATLGPRSRSMLLERAWGGPLVCNDGVTIAKQVELEDPEENLGARMLREAAVRTGDAVGDGTTTSTLIAHALFAEGLRNVVAGASAVDVRRGIDRGVAAAVAALKALSRPVPGRAERAAVATVSAHNDPVMGAMVADAMERVGPEGAVTLEEAKGTETVLEVVEGMRFDRGWLSPYFVTRPERMECVLEAPRILLVDRRISAFSDLVPVLERLVKEGRPVLVVAEDVEGDALATLVVNRVRGTISSCAVKAPGFGDRRKEILEDLAVLTGGSVVSADLGVRLDHPETLRLGTAKRVVVDRESTTVVGGGGERAAIEGRVRDLKAQLAKTTSDYDREKLEERLAKLAGGVAVIRVGAPSEADLKNRKEAFEDAIAATKAAVAEGIVPGGGLALVRAAAAVEGELARGDGDVRTGLRIVAKALEVPARQIARNSGYDDGVVLEKMRGSGGDVGFDAAAGTWGSMFAAGIVDLTKVVRIALENAASTAGVLLLAEGTITEVKKPKDDREGPALPEE